MTAETAPEEVELLDERAAFLEARRSGIGSTDVAAILGLSPRATPLTVYTSKLGGAPERPMSLSAWMGLRLENLLAEMYTESTGVRLRADARMHRHPQHDWLFCHVDRRAWGNPRLVVELKTRSRMAGWGDAGTAEVPVEVWCQVQAQMAVLALSEVHVAALFGHTAFRIYVVPRDDEFIATMIPAAEQFWFGNVIAGVPPAPTGYDEDTEIVRRDANALATDGTLLPATPEQTLMVEQYRLARTNAAQASRAEDELKNRLITLIGNHDGIRGSFGTIYFRRTSDSDEVAWDLIAGAYRHALDGASPDPDRYDAIVSLYTRRKPGHRRFMPVFAGEGRRGRTAGND